MEHIQQEFTLLIVVIVFSLGIFSQWLAWRIQWPSIVIMTISGLIIGPFLGLINPQEVLGGFYRPIISLAVALILFEGSTSLDIRELKGISKSVFRIVTVGAFLAWIGGSLAAHYIAGLSLEMAFIIGGLFVVTGPTVIIPLLRQAKLKSRIASVLKWEGIIVDPIGPLLALFAYEIIKVTSVNSFQISDLIPFFTDALIAILIGILIGIVVSLLVSRGVFPEYLKSPIILCFVLICFAVGEVIMHETGMLAVTVMGLTLARSKKYVLSIGSIDHFMENVSVVLTSTVFILLTASLSIATLKSMFSWPIILFVLVMLFLVRPLSIWISTIKTELTIQEKTLVSWIAPRGVVALTVSGYFAELLMEDGYANTAVLTSLTLALVFITVCAHGFTIEPIARNLGLANTEEPGILMVGASSFSITFANHLKQLGTSVLIADNGNDRLFQARKLGIPTYHGEILSEQSNFDIDLTPYETVLAMTGDASYNILVCQSYIPKFGYHSTYTLPVNVNQSEDTNIPVSIKANLLFGKGESFTELNKKVNIGYTFKTVEIKEKQTIVREEVSGKGTALCIKKKNGTINFITYKEEKLTLDEGDQLVLLVLEN